MRRSLAHTPLMGDPAPRRPVNASPFDILNWVGIGVAVWILFVILVFGVFEFFIW